MFFQGTWFIQVGHILYSGELLPLPLLLLLLLALLAFASSDSVCPQFAHCCDCCCHWVP